MRFALFVIIFLVSSSSAWAQRAVGFADEAAPEGALIVAMRSAEAPQAAMDILGEAASANLERAIKASGFNGEVGLTASFITGAEAYGEIHLVGIGEDEMRRRDWEDFGGRAAGLAVISRATKISVLAPGADDEALLDSAFGAAIGQYAFNKYKSITPVVGEPIVIVGGSIDFVTQNAEQLTDRYAAGKGHLAGAVKWVRDMQSEPANILYPEEFVTRTRALFEGVSGISIEVLDERDMERLGMGAILGVGQGSTRPPRIMIVRYDGGRRGEAPLVYAGKGITFDSGGVSLKPNDGMWAMKADMTGAAVVMGAAASLAKSRAPVNIVAIAALAENMPDGGAQRPGDVVRSMSGKTIEIMSTDAEGRLVLSDAVWYAQEEFNPNLLVDVATLTGSVGRALGDEYAGLFAREDAIAERLSAAGEATGEDLWRLPLHPKHDEQIKSVIADVKNGDTGAPGASTGAAFIGAFIKPETPWAHLDIAGMDWRAEPLPTVPLGASGFGVRLLDELARDGR